MNTLTYLLLMASIFGNVVLAEYAIHVQKNAEAACFVRRVK